MTRDSADRDNEIKRVLGLVLIANLTVASVKFAVGFVIGSLALVADAIHSLLDASSNIVGLVGITAAAKPPDRGHPYGHRRFESVASLVIGVLVAAGLVEVLRHAIAAALEGGAAPEVTWTAIGAVATTIVVNIAISRYEQSQGNKLRSSILHADADHTMSDALSATTVLASLVAVKCGLTWVDTLAAFAVAAFIGRTAWRLIAFNLGALSDAVAVPTDIVRERALSVSSVKRVDDIRSRRAGDHVYVDLSIHLNGELSLNQAHSIAHEVVDCVKTIPDVADVVVHTEPLEEEVQP